MDSDRRRTGQTAPASVRRQRKAPPGGSKKDGGPGPSPVEIASDKAAILEAVLNFYDEFAKQNTEQNPQTAALQFEAAKRRVACAKRMVSCWETGQSGRAFRHAPSGYWSHWLHGRRKMPRGAPSWC